MRHHFSSPVHLGSTTSTTPPAAAVAAWLSRHADLLTAAGAFTAVYFLLIRRQ